MRKKNAMLVKLQQQQKKIEKNAIMCKMESNFVRPLSRDKGTPGQEIFFVPGRPAGRPVP
jgi:hypothetical protein